MENIDQFINSDLWVRIAPFVINTLQALGILILGWIASRWVGRIVTKRLSNQKGLQASATVRPLLATIARYGVLLASIYAALTIAGIPASGLLAAFGAAGLAIALAVQGTLSNVAAGMMLVFLRAVKVGEYIVTPDVEGEVLEIGLFTTQLKAPSGILTVLPNAQLWRGQIDNYSRCQTRRVDVAIELSRDNDLPGALAALNTVLQNHKAVIDKDAASVIVQGFTPTSAIIQSRFWLEAANLRTETSHIRAALNQALRQAGYKLPPQIIASN